MRLLKPKDITDVDTLFDSLEWDMIELDFSIDKDDLESYHKELRSRLQHLCFNFNSKEYLRPDIYERFQKENAVGKILSSNIIKPSFEMWRKRVQGTRKPNTLGLLILDSNRVTKKDKSKNEQERCLYPVHRNNSHITHNLKIKYVYVSRCVYARA